METEQEVTAEEEEAFFILERIDDIPR